MMVPTLKGEHIELRAPSEIDVARRLELGTDPEIHRMYGGSRTDLRPYTQIEAQKWFDRLADLPHAWVIALDGQMIGEIRLHSVNEADRRASLAIGIAAIDALGRGFGTEATRLVLTHAFGSLGLHRVGLRVLAYNERAIASYLKCGFIVEGREREAAFVDGEWHDDIMMGILASEFAPVSAD